VFPERKPPGCSEPPDEKISVVVTVSRFFNSLLIILNKRSATSPHASTNDSVIIIGKRSPPIRSIDKFVWKVLGSGARHTRITGSNIARATLNR
jgi:hypothetical protein